MFPDPDILVSSNTNLPMYQPIQAKRILQMMLNTDQLNFLDLARLLYSSFGAKCQNYLAAQESPELHEVVSQGHPLSGVSSACRHP